MKKESLEEKLEKVVTRKGFLSRAQAKVVELLSTLPLVWLVAGNFRVKRTYYQANPSNALAPSPSLTPFPTANDIYRNQQSLQTTLAGLYSAYKGAYYKSRLVMIGKIITTQYYWAVPNNLPSRSDIEAWQTQQSNLGTLIANLANSQLIDNKKVRVITVDQKHANKQGQAILASAIYGTEILLLLGYEEIAAHLSYDGYDRISLSEKVELMNTGAQINRRSWFKLGAAAAGLLVADHIYGNTMEKSEQGKSDLEKEIQKMAEINGVSPEKAFALYFGQTPKEMISTVEDYKRTSQAALATVISDSGVKSAFESTARASDLYSRYLQRLFGKGVPQDLVTAAKCGYVTRQLQNLSYKQKTNTWKGLIIEGLAVAGTMAAIIVPAELINQKFPGKDEE